MTPQTLPPVTLVLGGASSGKTAWAESLVLRSGLRPVYMATAESLDEEMAERIAAHRAVRGERWQTVEEPRDIASAVLGASSARHAVLVDCLTLWLSNLLHSERDVAAETRRLVDALADLPGPVVLVSNELGHGLVPVEALSRRFRDEHGRLNQEIAAAADCVVFVVAGLPLGLKGPVL